jgi:hypothetical protein
MGCGALCPTYDRGCYGCYGPAPQANVVSLTRQYLATGTSADEIVRSLRTFNGYAPEFQAESNRLANEISSSRPTSPQTHD